MPFYNNTRVGGAMDTTHIYFNSNVSNDWAGVTIPNYPVWDSAVAYVINDIVFWLSAYYKATANIPAGTTTQPQSSADWSVTASTGLINYVNTNDKETKIVFDQTRAQPYLSNPSDYYVSVQRFTIESPNLPVFIPLPIVGQANINKTIYKVFMKRADNTIASADVIWVPQDQTAIAPASPVTRDAYNSPYYYCYSYQWFIKCVNTALESAFAGPNHPFMQFDAVTGLFTIQGWVNRWRTASDGTALGITNPTRLYFNTELYNLFSSLSSLFVAGTAGLQDGMDYQILFTTGTDVASASTQPYITNVITESFHIGTAQNDVYNTQEYGTLPLWSPIKSIVFTVSLLNVVADMIATPVVFENGNNNINAGKQNTDILPILIEHSVPQLSGTEYKPYIFYEPQGEYRLSDLYSDVPISGLQYSVYWKDTFGNLVPFYLSIAASATIKILFRKKLFNSDQV